MRKKTPKSTKKTFSADMMPPAEHIVKLTNGDKLFVSGLSTIDRRRYVSIRQDAHVAATQLSDWHAGGADASRALSAQGITVVQNMKEVRLAVARLKRFQPWPLAETPGWSGGSFVLTNGAVIAPKGGRPPLKAFTPNPDILAQAGSFKIWRDQLAEPLAAHSLPSFCIMTGFAAALLRETDRLDNFGFEFSGLGGVGKSTVLALASSIAGRSSGSDGFAYWRTCNATMNALETSMVDFNDMPLFLDEAGVMQKAGRTEERAYKMRDMVFRLAVGRIKQRHGERASRTYRFVYVTSSNRPLPSLLGVNHASEAEAISDRLINVPILEEREHGAFDRLPPGYASMGEFVSTLKRVAAEHYGHALPKYLRFLVKQRALKPVRIRGFIARTIKQFMRASGVDPNNGSQKRVAEAFAIVAAGGLLAQRARVLPASYRPLEVALDVWALHRDHGRTNRTFDDRLRALIKHFSTLDLDKVLSSEITETMLSECRCFLRTGRSGDRHLLVPKAFRDHWLPGWNLYRHDSDVTERLVPGPKRNAARVLLLSGFAKKTCFKFEISDLEI